MPSYRRAISPDSVDPQYNLGMLQDLPVGNTYNSSSRGPLAAVRINTSPVISGLAMTPEIYRLVVIGKSLPRNLDHLTYYYLLLYTTENLLIIS